MIIISRAPKITKHPTKLNQIWFQHHSPIEFNVLKPQSYEDILSQRDNNKNVEDYIDSRISEEDEYRTKLDIQDDTKSFTYATIVGFNKMEDANSYPGFTYFFQLTTKEIATTLFGIVANDDELNVEPQLGLSALTKCIHTWNETSHLMKRDYEPSVGTIDPRIEVIISFELIPKLVIPELEQRQHGDRLTLHATRQER